MFAAITEIPKKSSLSHASIKDTFAFTFVLLICLDPLNLLNAKSVQFRQLKHPMTKVKTMSTKQAYEQKLQSKLDEWSAQMDVLKAKADGVEAEARIEYEKQIEDLKVRKAQASEKLAELKDASEDAWEDLKAGLDMAWDSLSDAFESAMSRFK